MRRTRERSVRPRYLARPRSGAEADSQATGEDSAPPLWLAGLAALLLLALPGCQTPTGPTAAEERSKDLKELASTVPEVMPAVRQRALETQGYWENGLGMRFKPVAGTKVWFSIWETRVQDYAAYAAVNKDVDGFWNTVGKLGISGPTHPVVNVSWEDAKAFCQWLTEKERKERKLLAGEEYRLPTDEEWSWAVGIGGREGGGTPWWKNGRLKGVYPWGTQWPPPKDAGNYLDYGQDRIAGYRDGYESTSPVGSLNANGQGIYDLGGNVWEWCEDLFEFVDKWSRVSRGGSCYSNAPEDLLSSRRRGGERGDRNRDWGFRIVLVVGSAR